MAHKIIHISKHIIIRVVLGVLTGVVGFSIVYMLGFNKPVSRPSDIEIRKNTITAWRSYVALENSTSAQRDTLFKKLTKNVIGMEGYRNQDSVIRDAFIGRLETLKKTTAIDKMLFLLLNARIRYRQSAWHDFLVHYKNYMAIQDSAVDNTTRTVLIQELNTNFTNKNNNFTERLGRTIEDIANALAKKYKYPFSIADLTFFNPYYQNLKKINREEVNKLYKQIAPVSPDRSGQGTPG